ncbi:hypothetical protein MTR_7g008870 [Medicago truncatula]|uniref:Transmembrane protein n=1 Tax=Medicago truncatula TaxID=3880 RepID=G7KXT4_MEDTR|nr:hypothetical protein MTR_7g008870 [Medicago truncatula]
MLSRAWLLIKCILTKCIFLSCFAVTEKWLPELKTGVLNTQQSLEACKYVRGLWEQLVSTVVDWVTVDGQNVVVWYNHVKKLLTSYDQELLL